MLLAFLLTFISFFLPPLFLIGLQKAKRNQFFFLLPLGVSFQVAAVGILAVIAHHFLPLGATTYFSVMAVSSIGLFFFLNLAQRGLHFPKHRWFSGKAVAILVLLAGVLSLDNAVIFSRQGFSLEPDKTYFRPPLHDDMQRHTLVTNALIRKEGSPLLVGGQFLYQLTWHHFTAFIVSLTPGSFTNYAAVTGVSLGTGLALIFTLLWSLYFLRPALFLRGSVAGVLLLLLFAHADIYHFLVSSVVSGTPGIEADWSYAEPTFLRFFSLKLILLTAPQHAAFFCLLSVFLVLQHSNIVKTESARFWTHFMAFVPLFIYSPLMAGFFFAPYWTYYFIRSLRNTRELKTLLLRVGTAFGFSYFLHKVLFGFWPHELVQRPGTSSLVFFNTDLSQVLLSPLVAFGTVGILSVFVIFLPLTRSRWRWLPFIFWGGLIFYHYGVTDTEVRRHFSMVAAFLVSFLFTLAIPSPKAILKRREGRLAVFTGLVLTLGFHGYYLYSYLGKPSAIDPKIPWGDYFALNRIIETKFPGIPVIGAVDPKGVGNDYPVAMEVTPSFSMPNHAVIHTRVSEEKFKTLRKIMMSGDIAPYAASLGYRAIIWGPVEEQSWGPRVKKRFIRESELLATAGTVKMYRIVDNLKERFNSEADLASAGFYYKVAHTFAEERWFQESLGYYLRAVELDPKHSAANLELGKVLEMYDRKEEAAFYYSRAK